MIRRLTFVSLILLLSGIAALSAPEISADVQVIEMSIEAGEPIEHIFTLTNVGDELLVIEDVVPSCGCTTATLETYELQPGESVELPIAIDTTGFHGSVMRLVDIFSNDPGNPIYSLTFLIEAPEHTALTPTQLAQDDFLRFFYVLIDVRTPEEHAEGHLIGSINIPVSEFQENLDEWTPKFPTDVPLILYCKAGFRSAIAAQILFDAGFTNVVDLLGGMDEWVETYGEAYLFDPF